MNELKVVCGRPNKLVVTVWNDDTQQVVARNVPLIDLFSSEVEVDGRNELRGGRFTNWNSHACTHAIELKGKAVQPSLQHNLCMLIEWVNENIVGKWCFSFRDESIAVSAWGLLSFDLYLRFLFEDVEDAVLFRLRWT